MSVEELRQILELLKGRGFSSSTRLGIMIYLIVRRKAYFMDMVEDLNITPGNLWSHLTRLRDEGYVDIKYAITDRPRRLIILTDKGFNETIKLLNSLVKILGRI